MSLVTSLPAQAFIRTTILLCFGVAQCSSSDNNIDVKWVAEGSFAEFYHESAFHYKLVQPGTDLGYHGLSGTGALCRTMNWARECGHSCECARSGECVECGTSGDDLQQPTEVDIATSSSTLSAAELAAYPDLQQYPLFAFGVVPIVHLSTGVDPTLSLDIIARIYLGNITVWNHTAIAALNPGVNLPDTPINVYAHSSRNGITEVFTTALSAANPEFASVIGTTNSPAWNASSNCPSDEGVISCVLRTNDSIGYVHIGDHLPTIVRKPHLLYNGKVVDASVASIELAVDELGAAFGNSAGHSAESLIASLVLAQTPGAWPIVGYEYLVVRKNSTANGRSCEEKAAGLQFWNYFYTNPSIRKLTQDFTLVPLPLSVLGTIATRMERDIVCPETGEYMFPSKADADIGVRPYLSVVEIMVHGFRDSFADVADFNPQFYDTPCEDILTTTDFTDTARFALVRTDSYSSPSIDPYSSIPNTVAFPYSAFGWAVLINFCDLEHSDLRSCDFTGDVMDNVVLDVEILVGIYNGTITHWDDPRIVTKNSFLSSFDYPITIISTSIDSEENIHLQRIMHQFVPSFSFNAVQPENILPDSDIVRSAVYSVRGSIAVQICSGTYEAELAHFARLERPSDGHIVDISTRSILACANDRYDSETKRLDLLHTSTNPECWPLSAAVAIIVTKEHEGDCSVSSHQVQNAKFVRSLVAASHLASVFTEPLDSASLVPLFTLPEIEAANQRNLETMRCNGESVFHLSEDRNLVPDGLRITMFTICGIFLALSLLLLVWVASNKFSSVVRAAQPVFLNLIIIGCLMTTLTLVPMSLDDSSVSQGTLDFACQSQPFLYFLGTWLIFSALVVKEYRIRRLFVNKALKRVSVKLNHVMPLITFGFVVNLTILFAWTLSDPLRWTRVVTQEDEFAFPISSYATCKSNYKWLLPLILLQMVASGFGVLIAYQVRSLQTRYSEGKWMTMALVNQLEVILLAVPLLVLVHESSVELYAVKAVVVLMQGVGVLCMVVLSKVVTAYKNQPLRFILTDLSGSDTSGGAHGRASGRANAENSRSVVGYPLGMDQNALARGTKHSAVVSVTVGPADAEKSQSKSRKVLVDGFVVAPINPMGAGAENPIVQGDHAPNNLTVADSRGIHETSFVVARQMSIDRKRDKTAEMSSSHKIIPTG